MKPAPQNYDVTVALNYYTPYVSGVTAAARVIAEGFVRAGLRVQVVAGRHDPALPEREVINGVDVVRTKVVARFGKGIISPGFVPAVARAARRSKLLMIHMPMLESGAICLAAGRVPVVGVYQCDVTLPPGLLNRVQMVALDLSHRIAFRRSAAVVVSSDDYARHSRLWRAIEPREEVIPPPAVVRTLGEPAYRDGPGMHVGFLGRIVTEKGLEYLVEGFRALKDPAARLLIAGDYAKVAGGSVIESVRRSIGDDPRISVLGFIPDEALGDFYRSIDVFALPSVNPLEAYGLVQVEGMMCGVPALASDLPGVRQPVLRTGFGRIVPPRDAAAITSALTEMATTRFDAVAGAEATVKLYSEPVVIKSFLRLCESIVENGN
jgi:glycosyltransferase involved in cell wall biosynthesis